MPDIHYIDLARATLIEALKKLSFAQEYIRNADDFEDDEFAYIQSTINRVRKQVDRLGLYPPNK